MGSLRWNLVGIANLSRDCRCPWTDPVPFLPNAEERSIANIDGSGPVEPGPIYALGVDHQVGVYFYCTIQSWTV